MYRVVKGFFDLQDSDHWYDAGDQYPRDSVTVSDKRLAELCSDKNRQHTPLIEEVRVSPVTVVEPDTDKAEEKKPVKRKKETKK